MLWAAQGQTVAIFQEISLPSEVCVHPWLHWVSSRRAHGACSILFIEIAQSGVKIVASAHSLALSKVLLMWNKQYEKKIYKSKWIKKLFLFPLSRLSYKTDLLADTFQFVVVEKNTDLPFCPVFVCQNNLCPNNNVLWGKHCTLQYC